MSKHNNNNRESCERKCNCGRYITLGEVAAGLSRSGYKCPTCKERSYSERK